MTSEKTKINYELNDHIVIITINHPERRNAFDREMTAQMLAAMDKFESDRNAWVAIVTGAGEKAFCAGLDLNDAFSEGSSSFLSILNGRGGFAGFVSYPRTKPIIAAVNGAALGGGCEIILACDLVIAAEHAVFGQPEIKHGLFGGAGGAFRLPRIIPRARAMEMLLTGDPINAKEAFDFGLVNAVVPPKNLIDESLKLALRISSNAPLGVQANLLLARTTYDLTEKDLWERNANILKYIAATEDAIEGLKAFTEKRTPKWKAG